jgi:hypothetical protein
MSRSNMAGESVEDGLIENLGNKPHSLVFMD